MAKLPPPAGDPQPPRHWRDEVSGKLALAVEHYLDNRRKLTIHEIGLLRLYLKQWVGSPAWNASAELDELRGKVDRIRTQQDVDECVWDAVELGMDPL